MFGLNLTGPFKLLCDDLGPANMLVNNEQELKIVGVIDIERSYVDPAQLATVPPFSNESL